MGSLLIQNDFTHGELDPRLKSRIDMTQYYKGANKLRNVFVRPQGGARRRFGLEFIKEIFADSGEYALHEFEFSETKNYLLVFIENKISIYLDDVLVADVVTTYSGAIVPDLKVSQSDNLMIIVHPDHAPRQLERGVDDFTWTIKDVDFKFFPAFDFKRNYDAITFTLSVVSVGPGATLTSSAALFDSDYVGGLFISVGNTIDQPIGVARITGFTNSTTVTVDIITEFESQLTTGIIGTKCFVGEPAFSTSRGWPVSVSFYEDRLWFGGAKSTPQTLFGSKIGDFSNFDEGQGLDDEAIVVTIATNKISFIKHLIGDRTLQIFTTNAEFSPPQLEDAPLTPSNIAVRKQTSNGSTNVRPVVLDNVTFYVKKGGKGVMAYVFSDSTRSYESEEVSRLSPQAIINPVDSGVLKGSETDDANYMFLVNNDGSLAAYQTLRSEEVSAWTLSYTQTDLENTITGNVGNGKFKTITNVGSSIYFIMERVIGAKTVQYLEKFNEDIQVDSASIQTFGSPTTTITGLDHLNDEEVRVVGDGYVLQTRTVISGKIEIERAVTNITVGLEYFPIIRPMAVNIAGRLGAEIYLPKRIVRAFIDYYESLGIIVNGTAIEKRKGAADNKERKVPYLSFGSGVLDQAPAVQSGVFEYLDLLGWDVRQTITVTQADPLPLLITGIGYEVEP